MHHRIKKILNNLLSGCEEIESPLFLDRINRIFSNAHNMD